MNPSTGGHFGWHSAGEGGIGEHSKSLIFHNNAERKRLERNVEVIRRGHERTMRGYDTDILQLRREIRASGQSSTPSSIQRPGYVAEDSNKTKQHNSRASLRRQYIISRNSGSSSGSRVKVRDYINQTRHSQKQKKGSNNANDKHVSSSEAGSKESTTDDMESPVSQTEDEEGQGKEEKDSPVATHLPLVGGGGGGGGRDRSETTITDVVDALSTLPPLTKSDGGIISDYAHQLRMKVDPLVLTRRKLQQSMAEKNNARYQITPMLRSIEHFSFVERQNSIAKKEDDRSITDETSNIMSTASNTRRRGHQKLPSWELDKLRSEAHSLPPLLLSRLSTMTDKDLQEDLRKVRSASILSDSSKSIEPVAYMPASKPNNESGVGSTGSNNMALYLKMAIRFRVKFGQGRHSSQRVTSRQLRRGWGNSIQEEITPVV